MSRFLLCPVLMFFVFSPALGQQPPGPEGTKRTPKRPVTERAWTMLITNADHDKSLRRTDAIGALGTMARYPAAVQMVEYALWDNDRDVRHLAASTLGEMGSRHAIPWLKEALDDEAAEVVFAAAVSLWELGDRSGRGILEQVLGGERGASRGTISENMDRMHKFVTDPKGMVLFGLREGIGSVAGPYAMGFEVVQEFTKDRSVAARVVSANMLANEKSPRSLESLREALRDKNWVVRLAAVKALARAGDRGAVPALEERMEDLDEKPPVRMMAAASILNLQGKAVAPKESPGE